MQIAAEGAGQWRRTFADGNVEMKGPKCWYADSLTHRKESSRYRSQMGISADARSSGSRALDMDTRLSQMDLRTPQISSCVISIVGEERREGER